MSNRLTLCGNTPGQVPKTSTPSREKGGGARSHPLLMVALAEAWGPMAPVWWPSPLRGYLHSGTQRLWRGQDVSEPVGWCQASVGASFVLGWPASKRLLPSEETQAHCPRSRVNDARAPPSTGFSTVSESWVGPGDCHGSCVHATVRGAPRRHAEYCQRKGEEE
jgi:hypothetical protein